MEDILAMQRAAQERVRRMQEHSRKLCGVTTTDTSPAPVCKEKAPDERWLLLLLLLMLSQNGGNKTLLILLAYLIL